jgi:hypothetical protein
MLSLRSPPLAGFNRNMSKHQRTGLVDPRSCKARGLAPRKALWFEFSLLDIADHLAKPEVNCDPDTCRRVLGIWGRHVPTRLRSAAIALELPLDPVVRRPVALCFHARHVPLIVTSASSGRQVFQTSACKSNGRSYHGMCCKYPDTKMVAAGLRPFRRQWRLRVNLKQTRPGL